MSKCRRNTLYDINIRCDQTTKFVTKSKCKQKPGKKLSSSFTRLSNIGCLGALLSVSLLLICCCWNTSSVSGTLIRKTYSVWDLNPEELSNLLEQEKSLQKRKRKFDYFLRRRSKKSQEVLPGEEDDGDKLVSNSKNNLGNCFFIHCFFVYKKYFISITKYNQW